MQRALPRSVTVPLQSDSTPLSSCRIYSTHPAWNGSDTSRLGILTSLGAECTSWSSLSREQLAEHYSPAFNILNSATFQTANAVPSLLLAFSLYHPLISCHPLPNGSALSISVPYTVSTSRTPTLSQGRVCSRFAISLKVSLLPRELVHFFHHVLSFALYLSSF